MTEEAFTHGCDMAEYYCDPEHTCRLLDEFNHQKTFGGEQQNGQPCGDIFTFAQWKSYGEHLDMATEQAHCPLRSYIIYRRGQVEEKKKDTGKLKYPVGYQEAA